MDKILKGYKLKKNLLLPDGRGGVRYKEGDIVYPEQLTVSEEFMALNNDYFEAIPFDLVSAFSYELLFEQNQEIMKSIEVMNNDVNSTEWLFNKLKNALLKKGKFEVAAEIRSIERSLQPQSKSPTSTSAEWGKADLVNHFPSQEEIYHNAKNQHFGIKSQATEWEIVEMKHYEDNNIHPFLEKTCFSPSHPPCTIHSVKRIHDNQVFGIGDKVEYGSISLKSDEMKVNVTEIDKFGIVQGDIWAYGKNGFFIAPLKQLRKPNKEGNQVTDNSDVACISITDIKRLFPHCTSYDMSLLEHLVKEKLKQ